MVYRYPLVDGHGNFGSVDGDGAAAMRYTEARLSKISMEMLADINKVAVVLRRTLTRQKKSRLCFQPAIPTFWSMVQPVLQVYRNNIPPHNLREVIGAVVKDN